MWSVDVHVDREMEDAISRLAGPRDWMDCRDQWIGRAARIAGIPFSTARRLFYRQIRDPKWSIVESVRRAVRRLDQENEAKVRDEYAALVERIATLEAALASVAGGHAVAQGAAADGSRGAHRPLDQHEEGGVKG